MSRTQFLFITAAIAACVISRATAQSTHPTLGPDSKVMLLGKSNINSWACATSVFEATLHVDSSAQGGASTRIDKPRIGLSVNVPVRSLKCGRDRMNRDLYRTLKADSFPEIRYVLATYHAHQTLAAPDSFTGTAIGELTVAGKAKTVEVAIRGARDTSGAVRAEGGVKFLMTDFGVAPPTALFGVIRTKNAIEVTFKVLVDCNQMASPTFCPPPHLRE